MKRTIHRVQIRENIMNGNKQTKNKREREKKVNKRSIQQHHQSEFYQKKKSEKREKNSTITVEHRDNESTEQQTSRFHRRNFVFGQSDMSNAAWNLGKTVRGLFNFLYFCVDGLMIIPSK